MKTVFVNEVRHLKPGLRRAMLRGEVRYKDQEGNLESEKEHERTLMAAGQKMGFGGMRDLPAEHRINVLARDNLGRMPHIAAKSIKLADA
jgi:hypothetical protein